MKQTWIVACALGLLSFGCSNGSNGGGGTGGTPAVVCDDIDEGMRVLWGETHVHTRLSLDAFWFNSLTGTREAYQFAKGGTVGVACDDRTVACETRQLDRALDFAAISDHAEFLGLFDEQCRRDDPAPSCSLVEQFILDNIDDLLNGNNNDIVDLLLTLFPDLAPTAGIWQQIIADAEAENEPCEFTTFAAYEFSPLFNGSTVHRNVLFLGNALPGDVFQYTGTENEWDFFDHLEAQCGGVDDCEYLTIPHNPNLGAGRMFLPVGTDGLFAGRDNRPLTPEDAELRAKNDVVVEIQQLKGQSECMPGFGFDGLGNDEMDMDCFFENNKPYCTGLERDGPRCLPPAETICSSITSDPMQEAVPFSCSAPNDFMRGALAEGLKARKVVGVNPYQFGVIAATDQHNANPGDVGEDDYIGAAGVLDNSPEVQLGRWTCELGDPGCEDREFDPSEDAYYYARILEQPTCRWNTRRCVTQVVNCVDLDAADGTFSPESGNAGFEGCCDITGAPGSFAGTNRFDVIRERAWTSPIWHETSLDL